MLRYTQSMKLNVSAMKYHAVIFIAAASFLVEALVGIIPAVGVSEYAKYSDTGVFLMGFKLFPVWSAVNLLLALIGIALVIRGRKAVRQRWRYKMGL